MSDTVDQEKAAANGFFLAVLIFIIFGVGFYFGLTKMVKSPDQIVKTSYQNQEIEEKIKKI